MTGTDKKSSHKEELQELNRKRQEKFTKIIALSTKFEIVNSYIMSVLFNAFILISMIIGVMALVYTLDGPDSDFYSLFTIAFLIVIPSSLVISIVKCKDDFNGSSGAQYLLYINIGTYILVTLVLVGLFIYIS